MLFRADASLSIGTGHIIRCLTLADGLRTRGWECAFVCREMPGHLAHKIESRGHHVQLLPAKSLKQFEPTGGHAHSHAASSEDDAAEVIAHLAGDKPTWVIVDHYALAAQWEKALSPYCDHLMVIDDLADRMHCCDLLLDQTYGRTSTAYLQLISADARLLCGADYALLRPQFAAERDHALGRRFRSENVRQILVSLGGGDAGDLVGRVLRSMFPLALPRGCIVKVVTGWHESQMEAIKHIALSAPFAVEFLQGVDSMAQLMAVSDLAIGAAGSSSWERCCLGLPTVMMVLADNQRSVAEGLAEAGAATIVDLDNIDRSLPTAVAALVQDGAARRAMAARAAAIVDGIGTERVINVMEAFCGG